MSDLQFVCEYCMIAKIEKSEKTNIDCGGMCRFAIVDFASLKEKKFKNASDER